MKNTAKKILALVFVVAMICTLAVPAFAADVENIKVTVVDLKGNVTTATVKVKDTKANVEDAIKADSKINALVKISNGKVKSVNGESNVAGEFGTGSWVVAVNGKMVSEDLGTVAVEKNNRIVVYFADTTLGTKLAQVDGSKITQGIISLFYYDANGARQPLQNAKITVKTSESGWIVRDKTNLVDEMKDNENVDWRYEYYFTTDEAGQIWIAPEYLDNGAKTTFTIEAAKENNNGSAAQLANYTAIVAPLKAVEEEDGYTKAEVAYYNKNLTRNIVDVEVIGATVTLNANAYNVAGSTGDMTMVYVLVAAAAIVTLGAAIVMKKKATH